MTLKNKLCISNHLSGYARRVCLYENKFGKLGNILQENILWVIDGEYMEEDVFNFKIREYKLNRLV